MSGSDNALNICVGNQDLIGQNGGEIDPGMSIGGSRK
jgi:hypothetical protein